ncbi:MAG: tetratricopeptide repeat protein [Desulfobacteraceae bacterium]
MTLHTEHPKRRLLASILTVTLIFPLMAWVLSTPVWADKNIDPPPVFEAETAVKIKGDAIKRYPCPKNPKTLKNRLWQAESLRSKAVQAARKADFKTALRLIQTAMQLNEKSPGVHFDHMVILSWADRFNEAIDRYEQNPYAQRAPDYVRLEIARCYRLTHDFEKAMALYKSLLQKHETIQGVKGLALTYLAAGQHRNAEDYLRSRLEKNGDPNHDLLLLLARSLLHQGKLSAAKEICARILANSPDHIEARLYMALAFVRQGKTTAAEPLLAKVLERAPHHIEALFAKGELLERRKDYLQAYNVYRHIQSISPGHPGAWNLAQRALMNLGVLSVVREREDASRGKIDPELYEMLLAEEAAVRVRWEEASKAMEKLERNKRFVTKRITPKSADDPMQTYYGTDLGLRTHWDMSLALGLKKEMEQVVEHYEKSMEMELDIPPWVLADTADAYLYLERPHKALGLYRETLEKGWDPAGSTRMAVYHTLVELEQYKQAGEILEQLDQKDGPRIEQRGIVQPNWRKVDLALDRAWWFLHQDRLAEANTYLADRLSTAPFHTGFRSALAQTYLWRGWPRRALEEFSIVHTLDPADVDAENGRCRALDENDRGKQARILARRLLLKYPKNKHVQATDRYFEVQDKRLLTVDALLTNEDPGARETFLSVRLDQPIRPWRKIFAEYRWQEATDDELNTELSMGRAGLDWRLHRDWWLEGGVSVSPDDGDGGVFGHLGYDPNDQWSLNAYYDAYSVSVPAEAAARDIDGQQWQGRVRYRMSESFEMEGGACLLGMSDDNQRWSYDVTVDRALTTRAHWKTRLALEGYAMTNTKTDVPYFSPESLYSVYVVPTVEHTWHERYEQAFMHRISLGLGEQWQHNFASRPVWYVRYEHDHSFTQTFTLLFGTVYSHRNYDGEDTDAWDFYFTLKKYF